MLCAVYVTLFIPLFLFLYYYYYLDVLSYYYILMRLAIIIIQSAYENRHTFEINLRCKLRQYVCLPHSSCFSHGQ